MGAANNEMGHQGQYEPSVAFVLDYGGGVYVDDAYPHQVDVVSERLWREAQGGSVGQVVLPGTVRLGK